jgi:hypothetical protein
MIVPQVPLLWNRSPEAAAAKLNGIAKELGVEGAAAAALLMGAPALASINMPGVVRDRVEAVSDALGVSTAQVRYSCVIIVLCICYSAVVCQSSSAVAGCW